jgi:16S rRNA processing protein RimM
LNSFVETDGYIVIGKVVGVHGLKGTLRVYSYAESPSIFQPDTLILLRNDNGMEKRCSVAWAKPHTRGMLLALDGIDNRDGAEPLVGYSLFIEKALLPELEDDTYYWSDLIGLAVYDGQDTYLGRVASILPTGSNDVYVVRNNDDEVLVPALESVVLDIDLAEGRMTVELPEGL